MHTALPLRYKWPWGRWGPRVEQRLCLRTEYYLAWTLEWRAWPNDAAQDVSVTHSGRKTTKDWELWASDRSAETCCETTFERGKLQPG